MLTKISTVSIASHVLVLFQGEGGGGALARSEGGPSFCCLPWPLLVPISSVFNFFLIQPVAA